MYLITRVFCENEYNDLAPSVAVVELDDPLLADRLAMDIYQTGVVSHLSGKYAPNYLSWFDDRPTWYDFVDWKPIYQDGAGFLLRKKLPKAFKKAEQVRMETVMLRIAIEETDLQWSGYVKHTSDRCATYSLTWADLSDAFYEEKERKVL